MSRHYLANFWASPWADISQLQPQQYQPPVWLGLRPLEHPTPRSERASQPGGPEMFPGVLEVLKQPFLAQPGQQQQPEQQ
ncbi:hypothetical protein VTJ04DRAFT_5284 [Mycothermus thermophilus]|uniref:uncharacterized protein n=1 Tax=Humicola insolens TaxID=85995 RepID=UPI003744748A